MTKLPSVNVSVRINNVVEFSELVEKFNQKARELEEISHELMRFEFQGEIESQVLSDKTIQLDAKK